MQTGRRTTPRIRRSTRVPAALARLRDDEASAPDVRPPRSPRGSAPRCGPPANRPTPSARPRLRRAHVLGLAVGLAAGGVRGGRRNVDAHPRPRTPPLPARPDGRTHHGVTATADGPADRSAAHRSAVHAAPSTAPCRSATPRRLSERAGLPGDLPRARRTPGRHRWPSRGAPAAARDDTPCGPCWSTRVAARLDSGLLAETVVTRP